MGSMAAAESVLDKVVVPLEANPLITMEVNGEGGALTISARS